MSVASCQALEPCPSKRLCAQAACVALLVWLPWSGRVPNRPHQRSMHCSVDVTAELLVPETAGHLVPKHQLDRQCKHGATLHLAAYVGVQCRSHAALIAQRELTPHSAYALPTSLITG